MNESNLTFSALRAASLERLTHFKNRNGDAAHAEADGSDWSINDWTTALVGEVGEFANFAKKVRRGDFTLEAARADMAAELADVTCYLVILAHRCGICLEEAVVSKFNEVSDRIGSSIKLSDIADGDLEDMLREGGRRLKAAIARERVLEQEIVSQRENLHTLRSDLGKQVASLHTVVKAYRNASLFGEYENQQRRDAINQAVQNGLEL